MLVFFWDDGAVAGSAQAVRCASELLTLGLASIQLSVSFSMTEIILPCASSQNLSLSQADFLGGIWSVFGNCKLLGAGVG